MRLGEGDVFARNRERDRLEQIENDRARALELFGDRIGTSFSAFVETRGDGEEKDQAAELLAQDLSAGLLGGEPEQTLFATRAIVELSRVVPSHRHREERF